MSQDLQRAWQPADFDGVRISEPPRLSPSAEQVAFAVGWADIESDAYLSELWLIPTHGGKPARRLTSGHRDMAPAWSPDGASIAFVRYARNAGGADPRGQIFLLRLDTGKIRQLTDCLLGVDSFTWSPRGSEIAFVARVPEEGRYGTDPRVSPLNEMPRRISTLQYRYDGVGFTADKRRHVFRLETGAGTEAPRITQLTRGDHDNWMPCWTPDGERIAFLSVRHPDNESRIAQDVFVADRDGTNLRQITGTDLCIFRPTFSPEGDEILFIAHTNGDDHIDVVQRYAGLWKVPADGSRPAERLTDEATIHLNERYNARGSANVRNLTWHRDGILAERPHRGSVELVHVDRGGKVTTLMGGARQVRGFDAVGSTIVCNVVSETSWGSLVAITEGKERVLWEPAASPAPRLASLEPLEAQSTDGYPVHGWIARPEGEGPHPVLLMIHGGPFYQHGWGPSDEVQAYVGAGYAVLLANPRGSLGYGQAHSRSVIGKVFTSDADDLLAFVDEALTDPRLDAKRVGVLGVSYGGGMTSWLVGHTDRFGAAVSECAVNDWESFILTADIGYYFAQAYTSLDPQAIRAKSPINYAEQVNTPVLVIQSELDWCCAMEQGQKYYARLKRAGKQTEMLLFPGEGHMLFESGKPRHRVARLDAILEWLQRHLALPVTS